MPQSEWDHGYKAGYEAHESEIDHHCYENLYEELRKLEQENEALHNLLSANVRVIKQEILREQAEELEGKKQLREENLPTDPKVEGSV